MYVCVWVVSGAISAAGAPFSEGQEVMHGAGGVILLSALALKAAGSSIKTRNWNEFRQMSLGPISLQGP